MYRPGRDKWLNENLVGSYLTGTYRVFQGALAKVVEMSILCTSLHYILFFRSYFFRTIYKTYKFNPIKRPSKESEDRFAWIKTNAEPASNVYTIGFFCKPEATDWATDANEVAYYDIVAPHGWESFKEFWKK